MIKRLISILCIITMLISIATLFSSCISSNTQQAENYLKDKYHQTFEQSRGGIYTRGNNSSKWFFKDNDYPDVVFNVTQYDGKFSDNRNKAIYEKKVQDEIKDYFNKKGIDAFAFVNAMNDSTLEQSEYHIFFIYLAINTENHTENDIKEVFQSISNDKTGENFTFSAYFYDRNSYNNIVDKYYEIYDMNATYMEEENYQKHYSVIVKNGIYTMNQMK